MATLHLLFMVEDDGHDEIRRTLLGAYSTPAKLRAEKRRLTARDRKVGAPPCYATERIELDARVRHANDPLPRRS